MEDYSAHVCLDAVVFHNPPSNDTERVSHKNQWLQCPCRATFLLQEDIYPCLREARCLLLLCKNIVDVYQPYLSTQLVVCKPASSNICANRTQNSGLKKFVPELLLPYAQTSSIYQKNRNGKTFSDAPFHPEIFRWNDTKCRVLLCFQPDFPETFCKW